MMHLDKMDKKLLVELDQNSRQSASSLAKKLRTSQQVVSYRMKKLVDSNIITSYISTISSVSLGLTVVKMYIQYSGMTTEAEDKIYQFLIAHNQVNWVAKTIGKYDLFLAVMVKDIPSLAEFKSEFFQLFGQHISSFSISIIQKAYTFPRPFLLSKKKQLIKPALIHKKITLTLDENDKLLLKKIVDNSRMSIVDLARELDLNAKTVLGKIKHLQKAGVIQGYRINVNREKIGLKYYKVFIKLRSYAPKEYMKLREYCLANNYVVHLIECIGEYELELEIEMPNPHKIENIIRDIRNNYPNTVANIESCEITNEIKLTWLPNTL